MTGVARCRVSAEFSTHRTRKRFGQHWLVDQKVLSQIVAAAALDPGDSVLEVGPGRGALTAELLASPLGSLHAIELVSVDHHHRIPSVQRDTLRAIAVRPAHELAETGFGILKRPAAAQRLNGWLGLRHFFSSHGDQNSMACLCQR